MEKEYQKLRWWLIGMIGVVAVLSVFLVWHLLPSCFFSSQDSSGWLEIIRTVEILVLIVTGIAVWWQLKRQGDQNKMNRLVAWKGSLQSINDLILKNPTLFIPILYPDEKDQENAKRLTATYASLHALEVIYYMRKDEEVPPDRLKEFLSSYVKGEDFKKLWRLAQLRAAFTMEFQRQLNEIIGP